MPLATVCRLRGEKRSGFYTLSLCLTGCGVAWASLNFGQRFTDNLHSVLGFDVHAHVSVVEDVCSVSKAISDGFLHHLSPPRDGRGGERCFWNGSTPAPQHTPPSHCCWHPIIRASAALWDAVSSWHGSNLTHHSTIWIKVKFNF